MAQNQQRDLLLLSIVSGTNNGVFVETGTDNGHFAELVLSVNPTNTLFWVEQNDMYHCLKAKHKSRMLTVMPDAFDFLHIDGNRGYEFVKRDLERYFPKVRPDGFVLGSESNRVADGSNSGVVKAFTEFITANNLTGAGSNDMVFFKKTAHPTVAPCLVKTCQKNDICFVTRFKTAELSGVKCIQQLLNIMSFRYKLFVFVDASTMTALSQYKFGDNIALVDDDNVKDTFALKYAKLEKEIMASNVYEKAISNCRAKFTPEHTLSGHSKINFVRHAKSVDSDYMLYAWIDSDCVSSETNAGKMPSDKMTFCSLKGIPIERLEPERVMASDDVYINSSSFVVPNSLVEAFELLYEYKLIEWQTRWIADDCQSLVFQMVQDHPDLFHLVNSNLFSKL